MPTNAPAACNVCGKPNCNCSKKTARETERAKLPVARTHRRYREFRAGVLYKNGTNAVLCRHCLANGITRAAAELDHIIPLSIAPELMFELSNVQPLCKPCHWEKTKRERKQ